MVQYTLSELCAKIGEILEENVAPSYWVRAEISSLNEKGGHLYLELVEGKSAKMRATCWAEYKDILLAYFESATGQKLQAGMAVLVEVEIQWHAIYGLSLSIVNIDPNYTIGDLARQRQVAIKQLQADGLLDAQQLLPLPTIIRRIAVISSPDAAGYGDFEHQLTHSPYHFRTQLFPATMQGDTAASSIISAMQAIEQDFDQWNVVTIIRGGGATMDLNCFDRYTLCAVAAQFALPIITGIGHTRDISVLDLVAHKSLKTPTAVAEWLIHRMDEQAMCLNDLFLRLHRTSERQILLRKHRVELLEQRLNASNPEYIYKKGYSLLTKNGQIVRSVHDLHPRDMVITHLPDGSKEATINA